MVGQLVPRGKDVYLMRVFLGRDASGKRRYYSKIFRGKKREVEAALRKLQRDKDAGTLLEPNRDTLGDVLGGWPETSAKPRLRLSTYNDYRWLLGCYVRPLLGELMLHKLTTLDVQRVYAAMLARGLSPRTVQYTHRVLSSTPEQAVKWRMLERNPAQHAELPAKQRNEMRYLTDDEARRFLAAARGSQHFSTSPFSTSFWRPDYARARRLRCVGRTSTPNDLLSGSRALSGGSKRHERSTRRKPKRAAASSITTAD